MWYVSISMCGRYTQTNTLSDLIESYEVDEVILQELIELSFNLAPSQVAPVIYFNQKHILRPFHWGIQPSWAVPRSKRWINARSETVWEKPAFRVLIETQRCLVPASGFYEFQPNPAGLKTPHYFTPAEGNLISFAGLWTESEEGGTFTILTTEANEEVSNFHDRMPVVLEKENFPEWLQTPLSRLRFAELVKPRANGYFKVRPVSSRVNSPANNDPELILTVPTQGCLF